MNLSPYNEQARLHDPHGEDHRENASCVASILLPPVFGTTIEKSTQLTLVNAKQTVGNSPKEVGHALIKNRFHRALCYYAQY
jgi:hypothetical protein